MPEKSIDLRSDTMSLPSEEMKAYMCSVPLGDDVWDEDPTVHALQDEAAALLGKERALFFVTATQANLAAIISQCQRGEEYIVGNEAHCYRWEAGGAAVLGSVQPQPIPFEADGTLDLKRVEAHLKPDDPHFAITRLLCLENTQMGKVIPLEYMAQARELCDKYGLRMHLDGARGFNAATELGVTIREVGEHADTVTLCFSKIGCPSGALLVGDRETIGRALRWRKMLGGGLRQGAGMFAAAAQYALAHHLPDLAQDHKNAARLAEGLQELDTPHLTFHSHATNMAFASISPHLVGGLQSFAAERGVILPPGHTLRFVTHRDVSAEDIEKVLSVIAEALSSDHSNWNHNKETFVYTAHA